MLENGRKFLQFLLFLNFLTSFLTQFSQYLLSMNWSYFLKAFFFARREALTYLEIRNGIFCGGSGGSCTNDIIKPTALVLLILKFSGFSAQLLLAIYYSSSFQETNSPKEN